MPTLTAQDTQAILTAWDTGLESTGTLARRFPASPQGIRLLLRRHGRDTSKAASKRTLPCANPACSNTTSVLRMHRRNHTNHYCQASCYYAVIHNADYLQNRNGCRIARQSIRDLGFVLFPTHVVHHVDGNNLNNDLANLIVFASHADHMRWHRAGGPFSGVTPLLIGSSHCSPARSTKYTPTNLAHLNH